ncbi:hypothetical protein ACQQ2Q_05600 [Agrobacterium sp. ES01]|uniref:hypothetical protein n=1 Tax=Agrobacterium sp. ES01 TaxID=3420714 RepID=UPI003D09C5E3
MSGLETAIRTALERSDRASAEMRARIYQSARQALEAGLRKQNITDEQVIDEQRHKLEAVIHTVEQEERVRLDLEASTVAAPAVQTPVAPAKAPSAPAASSTAARQEPAFAATQPEAPRTPAPPRQDPTIEPIRHQPAQNAADGDFSDLRAERDTRLGEAPPPLNEASHARRPKAARLDVPPERAVRQPKGRSRIFSRMFVFATLFAAVGIGAWWLYSADVFKSAAERDTSVPNPPPTVQEEDYSGESNPGAPGPQQGFSDDWIEIFNAGQMSAATADARAKIDLVETGDGNAVHLVSSDPGTAGNVSIPVPVNILREMAGKTSTIALTMRAAGEKPETIAVECDFGRMGRCARHRFTVNPDQMDILLKVSFDRAIAPASPGQLLINSDLIGGGKGVDLYSIRILPGN